MFNISNQVTYMNVGLVSYKDLRKFAKENKIPNFHLMKKKELMNVIKNYLKKD